MREAASFGTTAVDERAVARPRFTPWRKDQIAIAVLAALCLFAGGVVIGGSQRQKLNQARAETGRDRATINALRSDVATRDAQIAYQNEELSNLRMQQQPAHQATASAFSAGLYRVGTDIAAGRYHTSGGESCYWAKLRTSDPSSYIDNRLHAGPQTVTVDSPYFSTDGCGTWTRVG